MLFVIDTIDQPYGATQLLARRLCSCLAANGHEVALLHLTRDMTDIVLEGVEVSRVICTGEEKLHQLVGRAKVRGKSKIILAMRLLMHPKAAWVAVQLLWAKKGPRERCCKKEIERLCAKNEYDAVLSVSAPHHTSFALADADIQALKTPILFDPYYTGNFYSSVRDLRKERRLLLRSDFVFVTDLMIEAYCGSPLKDCLHHVGAIAFPAMTQNSPRHPVQAPDPIRCVFCGNVYADIREPFEVFRVFAQTRNPSLQLVMVGGGYEQLDQNLLRQAQISLGSRLEMRGVVSSSEAFEIMRNADILVNIGNTGDNLLPSKIFDYMSTGRPILNFISNKADRGLPFLQHYSLRLDLLAGETPHGEQAVRIERFCRQNAGKVLSFEQASICLERFTPHAVAAHIIQTLTDLQIQKTKLYNC